MANRGPHTVDSLPAVATTTGALPCSVSFGWSVSSGRMLFEAAARLIERAVRLFLARAGSVVRVTAVRLARVEFGVDDMALSGRDGRVFE